MTGHGKEKETDMERGDGERMVRAWREEGEIGVLRLPPAALYEVPYSHPSPIILKSPSPESRARSEFETEFSPETLIPALRADPPQSPAGRHASTPKTGPSLHTRPAWIVHSNKQGNANPRDYAILY
jgi:hypothetical protein